MLCGHGGDRLLRQSGAGALGDARRSVFDDHPLRSDRQYLGPVDPERRPYERARDPSWLYYVGDDEVRPLVDFDIGHASEAHPAFRFNGKIFQSLERDH